MTRGETPAPRRSPATPGDPSCARAREGIAELLVTRRGLVDEPELRAHLQVCSDCNGIWRERLLADARWRRTLTETQNELDEEDDDATVAPPRRAVLSPVAIARAGWSGTGRTKATWIVILGVLVYVVIRMTPEPSGTARAEFETLRGRVDSLEGPLLPGARPRELQRGDWVKASPESAARLGLGSSLIEVEADSVVQIEDPASRRLRLERGSLAITGKLVVTCRYGWIEFERGKARISLESSSAAGAAGRPGGTVRVIEGRARILDAGGTRKLGAGESASLALGN